VLVIDATQADRDLATRHLQSAQHHVETAVDAKTGLAALERLSPDVVVLESNVPGLTCPQFIQRIRTHEHTTHAYVIVVSSRPGVAELTAAIAAGGDDFMRKPLVREELLVRVGALERIRGWAAKVFAPHPDPDSPPMSTIPRLVAWQKSDRSIAEDIEQLVGQPLQTRTSTEKLPPRTLGAQMPLTMTSEQTEVRLTVGIDAATIPKLAEICLGDPAATEDMMRDLMRELTNTAGGAFMRAAAHEKVILTCGLPSDLNAEAFAGEAKAAARQQFVIETADGAIHITFELEVLAKALQRVNVKQLTEGMVVARDLHTQAGALLVPAGTRLTASLIERMGRLLSPQVTFDVAGG
jgi:DNA-binding response OmpR family regulator